MITIIVLVIVALGWTLWSVSTAYNEGYRRGHHDGLKENFADRRKNR